jgi:transposase InsO family protein
VLFDRICRHNGVEHLLTKPRSRTTTGKVERRHSISTSMPNHPGAFPKSSESLNQSERTSVMCGDVASPRIAAARSFRDDEEIRCDD